MHTRPFWLSQGKAFHGRTKQDEEKEMTGMGRKTTEREKNKNRKGKLGKESQFF